MNGRTLVVPFCGHRRVKVDLRLGERAGKLVPGREVGEIRLYRQLVGDVEIAVCHNAGFLRLRALAVSVGTEDVRRYEESRGVRSVAAGNERLLCVEAVIGKRGFRGKAIAAFAGDDIDDAADRAASVGNRGGAVQDFYPFYGRKLY